jgi:O-methyltransferase domain
VREASVPQPGLRDLIDRLQELADYSVPLAIRAVCELGVADLLAAGPRSAADLAAATGTDAGALHRVLRALAAKGIFTEATPGCFGLTGMGQLLRGDHPLSLRDAYPMIAADLTAWARLGHTLRTGRSAFETVDGRGYYDYLAAHPEDGARFDRSVHAQNRLVLRGLLPALDWAGCGTIVDVAGGNGAFLAGLLARYKALRGVVFDLPHVVAGAAAVLDAAGVADRCEIRAGSFFDPGAVPAGADTYLLKTILHDWDDRAATTILTGIRDAMRPGSRLIVLEALIPSGDGFHVGKLLDLHSLVLVGGPDRSEVDFATLFSGAGLRLERVVPTDTLACLEVRRAAAPADS